MTVDEAHTYFVGNGQWLVHNCPPTGDGGGNNQPNPLHENEGLVDSYENLGELSDVGDDLAAHHVPAQNYMNNLPNRPEPYNYKTAPTIFIDSPLQGSGRHHRTQNYGGGANNQEYLNMPPRNALARDILDLRRIYREDGLYNSYIRQQLIQLTRLVRTTYGNIFKKG